MRCLPAIWLLALTAFSQTASQPTATLIQGGICAADKRDPNILKCQRSSFVLGTDVSPRVSRIDGKGPQDFGLKPGDSFNPRGKFQVSIAPGQHTVEMSYFQIGGGSAYTSEPAATTFTAVPGHTYSANAFVSGSRWTGPAHWLPLIYDETDKRIVSNGAPGKN